MRTWIALLLLSACPASDPPVAPVPGASAPLSIGLAGAPVELFGPPEAPTFEPAFEQLSAAGFDTFFPLFVVQESSEGSDYSGHLAHFLSPTLLGAGDLGTCRGSADPYAAADSKVSILFPGLVLLALQDASVALDTDVLAGHIATQADECWSDHPGVVTGFYTYDEPALVRTVSGYLGQPQLRLGNLQAAADVVRANTDLDVVLIEGPGELGLRAAGLPANETQALIDQFQQDVATIAPTADVMGFNAYPVPDSPLELPGQYVATAKEVAPDAIILSVVQGMGFGRISGGVNPGRAPTLDETRFMAIDSVVSGADQVMWYGASSLKLDNAADRQLWQDIRTVAAELTSVREAIVGNAVQVSSTSPVGMRAHNTEDGIVIFISLRQGEEATVDIEVDAPFSAITSIAGPPANQTEQGLQIALPAHGSAILRLR